MSTHDLVLDNDTGANFRADANNALAALGSVMAGTGDPGTMYAYELQARTDLGVLRQRNAANTGWIIRWSLAETLLISRSSNTILGVANHGCTIIATGTFTQTITAAATLTGGWYCNYRNDGTGVITLDANGSETINLAATLALQPGESLILLCDGTNFKTIGLTAPAFKVGNFTRSLATATGTQAITGVGFKPKCVTVFGGVTDTSKFSMLGVGDGATSGVYADAHALNADTYQVAAALIYIVQSGSDTYAALLNSLDADGFTLGWVRSGSPTGTASFTYKAER